MKKIAITVGQFIHRKGFDVLLNAWAKCDKEYELYIIGATPTKEYLDIKEKLHLENVHFEGFKTKEELNCYYQAADLFVFRPEKIYGASSSMKQWQMACRLLQQTSVLRVSN